MSFGTATRSGRTIDRTLTLHNVSTRDLNVVLAAGRTVDGVDVTVRRQRLRIRAGASATVVLRADTANLAPGSRLAIGVLELHVSKSRSVRVPWVVSAPDPSVDLLSHVSLKTTGGRVSDATPAVLSMVVGGIVPGAEPQIRPVDILDVQLWRNGKLLGELAQSRELLPGRYTFGLTGRGPNGGRLRRGDYTVRVVARPGDGT
ncbi:MAG: hypothetical protein E6G28_02420, partial [Actinobacteria bacterium]